ncbi:MAG: hypothetical protein EZS28_049848, partial [Streblomastix strix]
MGIGPKLAEPDLALAQIVGPIPINALMDTYFILVLFEGLWTGEKCSDEEINTSLQNDRNLFNNSLSWHFEKKTSGKNLLRFDHCPAQIASIPAVNTPSKVEQQARIRRRSQFTAEMMKPAPYDCKYKIELVKFDGIGAINLEIRLRVQIPPNIQIDDCAALLLNPYEGLTHTLDDGPVNDGILMAQLFISKRYNVVYLCDATHHEYYNQMHLLLTNVGKEIVSYFQ